jgi:hypothetical protein
MALPSDCLVCVPAGDFGSGAGIDPSSAIGYEAYVTAQPPPNNTLLPGMIICGMTEQGIVAKHYDQWRDTIGSGAANVGSKFGPELSVVAPGANVLCRAQAGYASSTGTSFATAQVAGIAALVRSLEPTLGAPAVALRIKATAAKTGQFGYSSAPEGPRNDHMGFGRADCAAATVWTAAGRSNMIVRDNPADEGVEPSIGWWISDVIVVAANTIPGDTTNAGGPVTAFPVVTDQTSALNGIFDTAVAGGNSTIGASGDHWVFVRVKNESFGGTTADARCIRVTCNLASCSTGFMFPIDWVQSDDNVPMGIVVAGADAREDGYLADPVGGGGLGTGKTVIFRLHVTAAQVAGIHTAAFEYAPGFYHACALAMVLASNDISPMTIAGDVRTQINNITQRNLAVV